MLAPWKVALLLAGSGFCALVYQIAWLGSLRLIFGSSTTANAAVIAMFMGGLGLGGLLLGRRADRHPRPIRLYANLELGITALAAVSPWLCDLARGAYLAAGGETAMGPWLATAARLLLSALVLGVPTVLMGGTLPAAVRAVQTDQDGGRTRAALLYGANTLGAVAGALVATFFLVEALGVRGSLALAGVLNLAVALVARARAPVHAQPPAVAPETADPPPTGGGRVPVAPILAASAGVGFSFLLMELVWYRLLGPILSGTSYTFGLILAFALLGIGVGGLLYARRGVSSVTLGTLAATCALEALCLGVPLALGDDLAVLALLLRHLDGLGFGGLVAGWSVIVAVVVLPAAVVAGYQFPVLVRLMGAGRRGVGREIGLVYAWNTAGAIAGSLGGGFGLLSLLTATGAWRLAAGLLVVMALGLALLARPRAWVPALLALAAATTLAATGPTAVWRHSGIGAGTAQASFASPNARRAWEEGVRAAVVWEREGIESSVALGVTSALAFVVNGKTDGNAHGDAPTQIMLTMLGAALHPAPRRALVVGLGTGTSAGWLGAVPGMEAVDVVELEPAVVEVARACAPVNRDVLSNPRVQVILGDAREVLPTGSTQYDLIASEPSNPYRAGISSLFTVEFYQAVAQRLTDEGLFLQWVQAYSVDAETIRTIYGTLAAVFDHVETWETKLGSDMLLVAAKRPLVHDLARVAERLRQEPLREALVRAWGVEGVDGLFSGFVASAAFTRVVAMHPALEICTDDDRIVEYGFARSLARKSLFKLEQLRAAAATHGLDRPDVTGPTLDLARVAELRVVRRLAESGEAVPEPPTGDSDAAARGRARTAWARGDLGRACAQWRSQPEPPFNPTDLVVRAECAARGGETDAARWIEALEPLHPGTAAVLRADLAYALGRPADAAEALARGFAHFRTDAWALTPCMLRALTLAQTLVEQDPAVAASLFDALGEPFAVRRLDTERNAARFRIAATADHLGLCARALEPLEPHVPWSGDVLRQRALCYAGTDRAGDAESDLQAWRDAEPTSLLGP
jgi:spermidine synthase/MFS family permease